MLNTSFPLVAALILVAALYERRLSAVTDRRYIQGIPRNTGLMFDVVVAPPAGASNFVGLRRNKSAPQAASTRCEMNRLPDSTGDWPGEKGA